MINETLEIQDIIQGRPVGDRCLYRTCFLLAKWHKAQGLTETQARDEIFAWANRMGIRINFTLNKLIRHAYKDRRRLTDNPKIYVSSEDIAEIKRRFDAGKIRMVALAMLCYAKTFANANGEFSISLAALADWVGLSRGNISTRYINELIEFEYVNKGGDQHEIVWNKTARSKAFTFSLNVPIRNSGEFELQGNDIHGLYKTAFLKKAHLNGY